MATCTMPDCHNPVRARGLCGKHYERQRVHGDPERTDTPHRGMSPDEVYESQIDRAATPDGCHLWTGRPNKENGYGVIFVEGRSRYAHRWGYERYVGPIPPGQQIRHTCDTPLCQNRSHWLLGSLVQNTADRHERGRDARGSRHGSAKLTEGEIVEIREQYAAGSSQQVIADVFGVTQVTISQIVRRKTWTHV